MIHCQSAIRLDRASDLCALDEGLKARLLIGVLQVAMAVVFVPMMLLILALVGVYMLIEWPVLRIRAAIRGDSWPLREPMWERLGLPG
jgi:hypothetical protein